MNMKHHFTHYSSKATRRRRLEPCDPDRQNKAPAVVIPLTVNRLEIGRLHCLFLFTSATTP